MDDLSGIQKDNAENAEASECRSTPAPNALVLRLEQKILELQGELEQLDVELPEGYKPPKFEMFHGTGDPKVHLRTNCDKLVGVGKDEKIRMKLFIRSLTGDALSWYISQDPKKWSNWLNMASDFMDRFRFNIENAPNVFYLQNLKKKPTETFRKYATRWRSEAAKVRPSLDEEQMNNMKGHTTDECRTLKDNIQTLIDNKVIQANKVAPNVRNNPLPNHRGGRVHVIETNEEWDLKGSIGLIREGDDFKVTVTLTPIVVQTQSPIEVEVAAPVPFEVEVALPAVTPAPFEVEVVTLFTVTVSSTPPFDSKAIPWDYVAEARRKEKAKMGESDAAQGLTRTGRVYTPEHLGGLSKDATTRQTVIETKPDDLWKKVQAKEYSVIDHLNKTPAQISILSLLQNSVAHKNALIKVLSESYVPNNITSGEMTNMVGQVLESHKIMFHKDWLPPEGLNHNRALHIIVQFEDKFIARVLVGGVSSLNICPLDTRKRLDKEEETLAGLKNLFLEDEDMDYSAIIKEEEEEGLTIQTVKKGTVLRNWTAIPSRARRVSV
ncbi:uncharacterized protein [Nicotiana sylvestris]|uniref:uncharacterized protein n=1 Tax=Nicotiana sylvestris TaxID=4096 RepID=UPI00388CD9EC